MVALDATFPDCRLSSQEVLKSPAICTRSGFTTELYTDTNHYVPRLDGLLVNGFDREQELSMSFIDLV